MRYRISVAANSDLEGIWRYTEKNWSREQAVVYYDLIMDKIEELAVSPQIGRVITNGYREYRYFPVEAHLIFYREAGSDEIEVIRILHKRMKIEERLFG